MSFTIVEEVSASNLQHSYEDIMEYAEQQLGMDIINDHDLLYIAEEGINASLPSGWKMYGDPEGNLFYMQLNTQKCQWSHPLDPHYQQKYQQAKQQKQKQNELFINNILVPSQNHKQPKTIFNKQQDQLINIIDYHDKNKHNTIVANKSDVLNNDTKTNVLNTNSNKSMVVGSAQNNLRIQKSSSVKNIEKGQEMKGKNSLNQIINTYKQSKQVSINKQYLNRIQSKKSNVNVRSNKQQESGKTNDEILNKIKEQLEQKVENRIDEFKNNQCKQYRLQVKQQQNDLYFKKIKQMQKEMEQELDQYNKNKRQQQMVDNTEDQRQANIKKIEQKQEEEFRKEKQTILQENQQKLDGVGEKMKLKQREKRDELKKQVVRLKDQKQQEHLKELARFKDWNKLVIDKNIKQELELWMEKVDQEYQVKINSQKQELVEKYRKEEGSLLEEEQVQSQKRLENRQNIRMIFQKKEKIYYQQQQKQFQQQLYKFHLSEQLKLDELMKIESKQDKEDGSKCWNIDWNGSVQRTNSQNQNKSVYKINGGNSKSKNQLLRKIVIQNQPQNMSCFNPKKVEKHLKISSKDKYYFNKTQKLKYDQKSNVNMQLDMLQQNISEIRNNSQRSNSRIVLSYNEENMSERNQSGLNQQTYKEQMVSQYCQENRNDDQEQNCQRDGQYYTQQGLVYNQNQQQVNNSNITTNSHIINTSNMINNSNVINNNCYLETECYQMKDFKDQDYFNYEQQRLENYKQQIQYERENIKQKQNKINQTVNQIKNLSLQLHKDDKTNSQLNEMRIQLNSQIKILNSNTKIFKQYCQSFSSKQKLIQQINQMLKESDKIDENKVEQLYKQYKEINLETPFFFQNVNQCQSYLLEKEQCDFTKNRSNKIQNKSDPQIIRYFENMNNISKISQRQKLNSQLFQINFDNEKTNQNSRQQHSYLNLNNQNHSRVNSNQQMNSNSPIKSMRCKQNYGLSEYLGKKRWSNTQNTSNNSYSNYKSENSQQHIFQKKMDEHSRGIQQFFNNQSSFLKNLKQLVNRGIYDRNQLNKHFNF